LVVSAHLRYMVPKLPITPPGVDGGESPIAKIVEQYPAGRVQDTWMYPLASLVTDVITGLSTAEALVAGINNNPATARTVANLTFRMTGIIYLKNRTIKREISETPLLLRLFLNSSIVWSQVQATVRILVMSSVRFKFILPAATVVRLTRRKKAASTLLVLFVSAL